MSDKLHLHTTCQDLVTRMSNLGMTIKTAGVAFFGAGVAHFLTSDFSYFSTSHKRAYCVVLALIAVMFNFLDASYLSRERAARHIDNLVLQNKWELDYIDLKPILENKEVYFSVKRINCFRSWAVWPILAFEILTVATMYFF